MLALFHKYSHLHVITKIVITICLGLTVTRPLNDLFNWGVVLIFSFLFLIHNEKKEALKTILIYVFIWKFPTASDLSYTPAIVKIMLSTFFIIKLFYLPFLAGKYFFKTSDVGSIMAGLDQLKIPMAFSIPIAVMFRFFPSFKEERQNIKLAMKIRGITPKNPFVYLEYVAIPMLVLSANLTDDIAKAAETKCIANPVKKTHYRHEKFGIGDLIFTVIMILLFIGGNL